jgi:hypothetical protein
MESHRLALALGFCTLTTTCLTFAQNAPVTTVSEPAPPPLNDPQPTAQTAIDRERARVRFGISAGFGGAISGFAFGAGPAVQLAIGAQLNDRLALYAQGLLQSVLFIGHAQGALMVEWSMDPSLGSVAVGVGTSYVFAFAGPPCADCVPPHELAITVPVELAIHAHRRSSTQVHRLGFRAALQLAPTFAVWRNSPFATASPLGASASLLFGWALR